MAALKDAFRRPGVLRNALSYYRALANPVDSECRTLMSRMQGLIRTRTDVPLLAITGETDGCMDTRLFDHIDPGGFPGGLRVERIPGAGHFCHQEKPEPVTGLLLDWLGR
jgi:pimeloyl-ACP methyl ester carboxylesterase